MDPTTELKRCPEQKSMETEPVNKKMKIEQSENQLQLCPEFSHYSELNKVFRTFRSNLKEKCKRRLNQSNSTLLDDVYTDLYIPKNGTEETQIKYKDIFKPLPERDKLIRSVMTKGDAGIGKTVSVQKFILDWTEEKENQDIHLIFPISFREINLMKNKKLSLLDLLHLFFPETKEIEILSDKYKVLFIFDGLDECRLSLHFYGSVMLCDERESTSVDVMLVNLIKKNLFPSSLIWITSRPAAADIIPSEWIDRVTEIQGFSDPQKEEYFRKRISDEILSDQIISHLKSSRSLYIMCHIPVFCWISVTVLERMLREEKSQEIPKTLTQMYTHFLIIQTNIKYQKDYEKKVKGENIIFKLGKLAFEQLLKGSLIFFDKDLRDCNIDVSEAPVYSGLCPQIFREEFGLNKRKFYSFVHLSIQEHLAALYAHLSAINYNKDVFTGFTKNNLKLLMLNLYQRAVNEAIENQDCFVRFLLCLSKESNQSLLQNVKIQRGSVGLHKETIKFIKNRMIKINQNPEKIINLFHCLNELRDQSIVVEIKKYLKSAFRRSILTSPQLSSLVLLMQTSGQKLNKFNMCQFVEGENFKAKARKVFKPLLPVICESKIVELCGGCITDEDCVALSSALTSNPSHLRELNLSYNNFGDSKVKLIADVLKNPQCKLEKLWLNGCSISYKGCGALMLALRSNPSHLRELNLSRNNFGDSGALFIADLLTNPQCKLEKLWLEKCFIKAEGCVDLTSAFKSDPSHLKALSLSYNNIGDSGVEFFSALLENPQCKLESLWFNKCNITDEGCVALSSALTANPSHLRELDLSRNHFGDLGVKLISAVLENRLCKLETLRLFDCYITAEGCFALTSALKSNPSHLTELNLSSNNLGDLGVKLISDLKAPYYNLKKILF